MRTEPGVPASGTTGPPFLIVPLLRHILPAPVFLRVRTRTVTCVRECTGMKVPTYLSQNFRT